MLYLNYGEFVEVIKKYSNFVGVPIYLNGKRANIVQVSFTGKYTGTKFCQKIDINDYLCESLKYLQWYCNMISYFLHKFHWMLLLVFSAFVDDGS